MSLPPCTDVPMTVVDVTTRQVPDHVNVSGVSTAIDVTMRYPSGKLQKFWDMDEEFTNHARAGATILLQYWEGRPQELISGQDISTEVHFSPDPKWHTDEYYPNMPPNGNHHMQRASCWLVASVLISFIVVSLLRARSRWGIR
ncbi:MAG: hypothetical protein ACLQVD_18395 [Capsulimonadaceae bacterium]